MTSERWEARLSDEGDVSVDAETTDLVVPSDLTNEVRKRLIDINPLFRGRLDEFAVEMLGEVATLYQTMKKIRKESISLHSVVTCVEIEAEKRDA